MLKTDCKKIYSFMKEHKREILLSTGLVITGMALYKCKNNIKDISEIALNSLDREESRILYEIKDIAESIERLDKNAPINKFDRIPRRLARIEELELNLVEIRKDKNKVIFK